MNIMDIVHWFQNNLGQIVLIGIALDQLLFAISPLTPWKWDDNLAIKLRDLIAKIKK